MRPRVAPVFALLVPLLAGCMSFSGHFGSEIAVENLTRIQDGVTTRQEITELFGPPSSFYNPTTSTPTGTSRTGPG